MNLKETIYKRKSCRNYLDEKIDDKTILKIKEFIDNAKPLDSSIKTQYEILDKDEIKTMMRWKAPHYIAIYSEEKEHYKENIGFIYQQVDLYLQSIGLGSCWIGMAKVKKNNTGLKFVIIISFGKAKESLYRNQNEFKRKTMKEITDKPNDKLEVVRLAPSSINYQPWFFKSNGNSYDVFLKKGNFIKSKLSGKYQLIDIGIAISHLYVAYPETFEFHIENKKEKGYIGTVRF